MDASSAKTSWITFQNNPALFTGNRTDQLWQSRLAHWDQVSVFQTLLNLESHWHISMSEILDGIKKLDEKLDWIYLFKLILIYSSNPHLPLFIFFPIYIFFKWKK